ncbi:hypothetical protein GGR21_003190 [Dysgonomonas hofstadii]|uniref:Uncharacterized protein n=1 Tax=Dysgonomonas hofstadii TaxID=637886 RepID=A0A840CZ85_9BACT|nr:hypothetical protein [Dysgonomonas hofstadii]
MTKSGFRMMLNPGLISTIKIFTTTCFSVKIG